MKSRSNNASPLSNRARELRTQLARKITLLVGSEENRATDIPGVTLHRRIAPTARCSTTYDPGDKQVRPGTRFGAAIP